MDIRRKRANEAPVTSDGYSVLVHRLWPRGLPTTDAQIDEWARAARLRESPRRVRKGRLTLVYSRDEEHDAAVPAELPRRERRSV